MITLPHLGPEKVLHNHISYLLGKSLRKFFMTLIRWNCVCVSHVKHFRRLLSNSLKFQHTFVSQLSLIWISRQTTQNLLNWYQLLRFHCSCRPYSNIGMAGLPLILGQWLKSIKSMTETENIQQTYYYVLRFFIFLLHIIWLQMRYSFQREMEY